MNKLKEKRALAEFARRFGQEPESTLLEDIARLERDEEQRLQREAAIRQRIAADLVEIFNPEVQHELVQSPSIQESISHEPRTELTTSKPASEPATATHVASAAHAATSIADRVARVITEQGVVAPDPVLAQPQKDLEREVKYLKEWVSRIAATGPGGGAGDILNLDTPVTVVNNSSYTISRRDYYVGINVATSTTVVLPGINTKAGRSLIIKDESGNCSKNNITIAGTIDNDTSGAILAIDNGALHLIYRQGWRIV